MRQVVKIMEPSIIAIAREIHTKSNSVEEFAKQLEKEAHKKLDDYIKEVEDSVAENTERLRLALSMPTLIEPRLDTQYLEQGVVFLHHGVIIKEGNNTDAFLAKLFKMKEH
jgi:hypothetical protein